MDYRKWHFIYCPLSGSKWLKDASPTDPHREIKVPFITYANNCIHVFGVLVEFETAQPGSWWREAACEYAAGIARYSGGVAYDSCGDVGIIFPTLEQAEMAIRPMWTVRLAHGGPPLDLPPGNSGRQPSNDAILLHSIGCSTVDPALFRNVSTPEYDWRALHCGDNSKWPHELIEGEGSDTSLWSRPKIPDNWRIVSIGPKWEKPDDTTMVDKSEQ